MEKILTDKIKRINEILEEIEIELIDDNFSFKQGLLQGSKIAHIFAKSELEDLLWHYKRK